MKNEHMTISIPSDIKRELYQYVAKRGISRFIAEAVVEKLRGKKLSLDEQYRQAGMDEERNREFKVWEDGTVGDGLNESNKW